MYRFLSAPNTHLQSLILPALLMGLGISLISKASNPALLSSTSAVRVDDKSVMPDTITGERMKMLLKLFQSDSPPAFDSFLDRYESGSSKQQRADWKEQLDLMYTLLGTEVRFNDVLWSEDLNLGIRVSNPAKTKWHKIVLELTEDAAHNILRLGLRKAIAPDPADTRQLTTAQKTAIVHSVAAELRKGYIIESMGQKFADHIETNLKANVYEDITNPKIFAARMTEDLRSVYSDAHLAVAAPEKTPSVKKNDNPRSQTNPEPNLEAHQGQPKLEAHGPGNLSVEEAFKVKLLRDDTIGLVTFTSMYSSDDEAETRVATLMNSLTGVEAIIFDLRNANGGDPSFVNALSSYFFEKPTLLSTMAIKWPPDYELTMKEFWTSPNERSGEFASIPIYILISQWTASGPEGFTANLKGQDRAILVGERTAGAGHLRTDVIMAEDFVLKLPIGRSIDPKTGKGFEGKGHAPDLKVPAAQALEAALELIGKE